MTWSNKQLCFIFIGMTILFTGIRWDTQAWVKGKLDQAIVQNQLHLTYQRLDFHAATLQLYGVHLDIPNMPKTLALNEVQVQLDWGSLWHGRLAMLAGIHNDFMQMSTVISMQHGAVALSNMVGQMHVQEAQAWYDRASLAQGRGELVWQGDITLNTHTGLPTQTDMQVSWKAAAIAMMQQNYELGDYTLKLTQSDHHQLWSLQGGEQLKLHGNGMLQMNQPSPLMWSLQGNIDVQASKTSPLSAFLPKTVKKVKLMGVLGQPRWLM